MKLAITKGFSFGLTSAIITTLGVIVGLNASTNSRIAIIGGILAIAIADSFSDALGIHISEEAELKHTQKEIWTATISTFFTKFIFALTFMVPILILSNSAAITASLIWGFSLLGLFSYFLAKKQKVQPWKVIAEHLLIAIVVILITNFVGQWISQVFV
jgi:vacuolar iron transporter family protein